ncbi:MAG: hypothetical protein EAZ92_15980 [Candidatus Kapaibacterium sp.]|nr:MAG: hypothetical protein EAZ92_15980 [Candidatus Kapabacteria bacterium]
MVKFEKAVSLLIFSLMRAIAVLMIAVPKQLAEKKETNKAQSRVQKTPLQANRSKARKILLVVFFLQGT